MGYLDIAVSLPAPMTASRARWSSRSPMSHIAPAAVNRRKVPDGTRS